MDDAAAEIGGLPDALALETARQEAASLRPYRVRLSIYEGPMDLLLFLVGRREVDVYDVPIAEITEEYFEYLVLMEVLDIEVAGEFLVMAASLMVIKARTLLPIESDEASELEDQEDDGIDPRVELQRRLLEYQQFRESAEYLRTRIARQDMVHGREGGEAEEFLPGSVPLESVSVFDLLSVFKQMLVRAVDDEPTVLEKRQYTVAGKMTDVVDAVRISPHGLSFFQTVSERPTRLEVVVTFLAILELIRRRRVSVEQRGIGAEIRIFAGPELDGNGA
jgi:segregation and condensation protein A